MPALIEPASKAIPKVPGLPVLGRAASLMRDPLQFVCSLRDYGPMAQVRIGPMTLFFLNDQNLVRQLLVDKAHSFEKGRDVEKLRLWWGNGLPNSSGPDHLRQRRLMQPAFHREQVAGYVKAMQQAAQQCVTSWPTEQPIHLDEELYVLLVTMIAQNLFSTDLDKSDINVFQEALPIILNWVGWLCLDTTDLLGRLPLSANRRFQHALDMMHSTIDRIIDHHETGTSSESDLLSMLQAARDEGTGQSMSRQQIHDEAMTLLVTGSETTRNSLSWACHLLSRHPDIQRAVQDEVDHVLADRPCTADDLGELALTRRVITESLRIYPPTWLLIRRARVDVELGPYRIPAGATLCFSAYAIQRDPELYPEPDQFDPARWLPGRAATPHHTAFLAFGAGNRGCIGEPVAWAQTLVTLATIVQHWTLKPSPGEHVKPVARLQLTPDHLPMTLQPRHTPASDSSA